MDVFKVKNIKINGDQQSTDKVKKGVMDVLKNITGTNIDENYEITNENYQKILKSNNMDEDSKTIFKGIFDHKRSPSRSTMSNERIKQRLENVLRQKLKTNKSLANLEKINMVKKSRNLAKAQINGNESVLPIPESGVETGNRPVENAKAKPENMNKKMIEQILASEFPFPLIAYFYGNFMRDRPIKNYNQFLEEWERFIKNHGNKKVPFALASERFGNQPHGTHGNGKEKGRERERGRGRGRGNEENGENEREPYKRKKGTFRNRVKGAYGEVKKALKGTRNSAKKAAKKIRTSASKAAKKIRTSAMRRMGLNDAYNELMQYANIPKSNIAEYTQFYNSKLKEMNVIMNKKYKQYSNQKTYDKFANVSAASIGYIDTFYSLKFLEMGRIKTNDYTTLSSKIKDFNKSALQYASSRVSAARIGASHGLDSARIGASHGLDAARTGASRGLASARDVLEYGLGRIQALGDSLTRSDGGTRPLLGQHSELANNQPQQLNHDSLVQNPEELGNTWSLSSGNESSRPSGNGNENSRTSKFSQFFNGKHEITASNIEELTRHIHGIHGEGTTNPSESKAASGVNSSLSQNTQRERNRRISRGFFSSARCNLPNKNGKPEIKLIEPGQFRENNLVVIYLCEYLFSNNSRLANRVIQKIRPEHICFLISCKVYEKPEMNYHYIPMEKEDNKQINEIIKLIPEDVILRINNVMKKHFENVMSRIKNIRNPRGGNRKRSSLKRIMKQMPTQKRVKL